MKQGPTSAADKYSPVLSRWLCCRPNKTVQEKPSKGEREEGRGKKKREQGMQERGEGERQGLRWKEGEGGGKNTQDRCYNRLILLQ